MYRYITFITYINEFYRKTFIDQHCMVFVIFVDIVARCGRITSREKKKPTTTILVKILSLWLLTFFHARANAVRHIWNLLILLTIEFFCLGEIFFMQWVAAVDCFAFYSYNLWFQQLTECIYTDSVLLWHYGNRSGPARDRISYGRIRGHAALSQKPAMQHSLAYLCDNIHSTKHTEATYILLSLFLLLWLLLFIHKIDGMSAGRANAHILYIYFASDMEY